MIAEIKNSINGFGSKAEKISQKVDEKKGKNQPNKQIK